MPRVLVIDDDKYFADEAVEELRCEGLDVDVAYSYTDAIKSIESVKYDVVTLDVMMRIAPNETVDREATGHGRYTGLSIYRELTKACPETKVVIVSVLASGEKGLSAIKDAIDPGVRVVKKPVSVKAFVDAVRRAAGMPLT